MLNWLGPIEIGKDLYYGVVSSTAPVADGLRCSMWNVKGVPLELTILGWHGFKSRLQNIFDKILIINYIYRHKNQTIVSKNSLNNSSKYTLFSYIWKIRKKINPKKIWTQASHFCISSAKLVYKAIWPLDLL